MRSVAGAIPLLTVCLGITGATSTPLHLVKTPLHGDALTPGIEKIGLPSKQLRCGPRAANRRIFLYATGRPLKEFQAQLTKFVPFSPGKAGWVRQGEVQIFDEDGVSANSRLAAARRELQKSTDMRRAQHRKMGDWLSRGAHDSQLDSSVRRTIGQFRALLESFPPAALQAAFQGRPTEVTYDKLNARGQAVLRSMVSNSGASREGGGDAFNGARDFERVRIWALPTGSPDAPGIGMMLWFTSYTGKALPDVLNPPDIHPQGGPNWTRKSEAYRNRRRGPEGRERFQPLQRRVTLSGGPSEVVENVLAEFSKKTGLPILGEYDPCFANPADRLHSRQRTLPTGTVADLPAWEALDKVAATFDLEWEYRDGWVWVRSPRTLRSYLGILDLAPPRNPKTFSDMPDTPTEPAPK